MVKRYKFWVMAALIIVAIALPGCAGETQGASSTTSPVQDVTSREALNLIQENRGNPNFIILDVRTAPEVYSGYIEGALNIDVSLPSFREEMEKLNTDDVYLVYCRTGNRSKTALMIMEELGFTRVYHLVNGITEWIGAGLPVSR